MAKITFRNLVIVVQRRCLKTSSKIPPLPPLLPQSSEAPNFAVQFLTNSCGLPLKSAIPVSQMFQIQEKNEKKLRTVLDFFKGEGFFLTQIATLIQKRPAVLHSNVETNLKPKVELLKQNGFVGEFLPELIVRNPGVLGCSVCSLTRSLEFVKSYLESHEKIVIAIRRNSWLLLAPKGRIQHNIEFLIKEGMPASSIPKIFIWLPRVITQNPSRAIYAFNAVKKLRLQPSSPKFFHAFRVMASMGESTWKKKMEFLLSFGWSEEVILAAFKRYPTMLGFSEGRIRKSIDFYLNTMKLDVQTIMTYPELIGYAVDTRVHPRYIILKILKSKKLIQDNRMTFSWISIPDEAFLSKYVIKYEDQVPGLLDIYSARKRAEKIGT